MSLFKKSEDPWDRKPGQVSSPVREAQEEQEDRQSPLDSLRQWNDDRRAEKARKEAESAPVPMTCPWCGKRLEVRYLWGGKGVYLGMKRPGLFSCGLFADDLDICDEGNPLICGYKTVWYCPDCRKLIVDFSEQLSDGDFQKMSEARYQAPQTKSKETD